MPSDSWIKNFKAQLFSLTENTFHEAALELFRYQAHHNPVYAHYIQLRKINPQKINTIYEIPFLPISLFKTHQVVCGQWKPQAIFTSSTTTGATPSKHYIYDLDFYHTLSKQIFEKTFGSLSEWVFMPLLPSYAEREGSSLIEMVNYFISQSANKKAYYYLHNYNQLKKDYINYRASGYKVAIVGVTFALLNMAEETPFDFSKALIIETGGMKGRRKELIREQVHLILKENLNVPHIASEYGMTELLSQAYSTQNGIFTSPPTLKILIRDVNDPFTFLPAGQRGAVNIIDLANIHTCSFIETQDLGLSHTHQTFEIIGRTNHSELRGCNLMVWQ